MDGSGVDRPGGPAGDDRRELLGRISDLETQLATAQRLAATGVVAAMAIHEFRNIFTPLGNWARMAQRGSEKGLAKTLQLAGDGAPRAEAICEALLDLACGDPTKTQTITVADLIDETLAAMGRDPAKDGIRLVRNVPPGLWLRTRPVELKQVLLNLLMNARDAVMAKASGRNIEIEAIEHGDEVHIRVGDTGVGIRPEDIDRVFDPLFTAGKDDGCGLGLAVCRRLAESLEARLTCRSELGKGTWFTLAAPAKAAGTPPRKVAVGSA